MIPIRFVTSSDPVSAGIRAMEYGFWASHVEAIMPDGRLLGAHFQGGVMARPKGYDGTTRVREVIVPVPATPEQEEAFWAFLNAQLGKPYDDTAILAFLVNRDWQEPDSWFCSELIAAALMTAGILLPLATQANKITPRDVLLILSSRIALPEIP
jgi:hypothetical protein